MRIAASELSLTAASASRRFEYTNEQRQELAVGQGPAAAARGDSVDLSQAARELASSQTTRGQKADSEQLGEATISPPLLLAAQILARFFGRDITVFIVPAPSADSAENVESVSGGQGGDSVIRIQRTSIMSESEAVQMLAQGTVQTSDGREIDLELSLELSRSWLEVSHLDMTTTEAALKDPLVLNLSGRSMTLGAERFDFDLSANGAKDRVATLGYGSAFLALDRNGNDVVDDGSELFGAISGDGFGDLARLDEDGNGWIDEGDKAFGELRLWLDAGQAGSQLKSLAEVGVGAISLSQVSTAFSLKDSGNQLLGAIRATGLFLYEDGRVGSAQQIDLAV